ncbi:hypothetical protein DQ04_17911000, partial [Trypanosoma grayi]|uniref:hypothetical protein n=1 Tax=Trypanosoma grayi TaxID=71804 RepID=UPI0004F4AB3D
MYIFQGLLVSFVSFLVLKLRFYFPRFSALEAAHDDGHVIMGLHRVFVGDRLTSAAAGTRVQCRDVPEGAAVRQRRLRLRDGQTQAAVAAAACSVHAGTALQTQQQLAWVGGVGH